MHIRLTEALVDELEVQRGKERTLYFDTHPKAPSGFFMRVTDKGARTFFVLATHPTLGRQQVKVGVAEGAKLEGMRRIAHRFQLDVEGGRDINGERRLENKAAKAARLKDEVAAEEWTVSQLLRAYVDARASLKPSSRAQYIGYIAREIDTDPLGAMKAVEVVRKDVRDLVTRLAARAPQNGVDRWTKAGEGVTSLALAVLTFIGAGFRWGQREEYLVTLVDGRRERRSRVDRDPTTGVLDDLPHVRAAGKRQRTRVLSDPEIVRFWDAVGGSADLMSPFVRLLLLCGTRRHETILARWTDVQLDGQAPHWFIPAENRKGTRGVVRALEIPLSPLALSVLREVKRADGPRVFHGLSEKSIADRMRRVTGLDVTNHDLRRTCATGLQRLGAPPHVLSVVLGHAREAGAMASDASYLHDRRGDEHRLWLNRWAAHVEKLLGMQPASNVVPMRA